MSNSTVTISGNDPSFEHEAGQLFGPCIFGWCLQLILAGLTVSMAWHWFNARRAEKRAIKALVAGALAFNLASAGLNFAQIYRRGTLVPEENYSPLYFYTPSILAPIFISGASVCTHGYLGYRTWKVRAIVTVFRPFESDSSPAATLQQALRLAQFSSARPPEHHGHCLDDNILCVSDTRRSSLV
jgi:hypothetical protein